jgi:dUTP pyrophosphatase
MDIQIQKLTDNAKVPKYAYEGDAGLDLTATKLEIKRDDENRLIFVYGTGLSIAIPEGFVGLLFPRSSISKYPLQLCNSVGVIDSNYRGEIICKFRTDERRYAGQGYKGLLERYKVGDRIAQLIIMPYPQINFKIVKELNDSVRARAGFGSSGQ